MENEELKKGSSMESFAVCVQAGVLVTRLETGDLTQHQSHCHFYQFLSAAARLVSPLQDYKVTAAPEKQFDTVSRRFDFQSSESENVSMTCPFYLKL